MFSCPAHNFFSFDIGLSYFAHGCITIRRCVANIHDQDTTLKFDPKVFIGFLTCFRVRAITFVWIDIGLPYLAHRCILIRRCVAYIPDPDTTLNIDLKIKFKGFCHVFLSDLLLLLALTLANHIWHMGVSP